MSTSGFSADDQQDQIEYYCIPRKFVFDVPEKQKDNAKRTVTMKRTLEAEKHMPFIFTFPEPENYKDSYSLLVKQITAFYNQIRLLVVEDHYEELKHALKQPKLDQPGDCLSMLRDLFNGCCEVMKANVKDGSETDDSDSVKNYEELLQKAEAKIRTLIRNEQIFRLNFEIMTQKVEDAEKALQAANQELENGKRNQEKIMREVQELTTKLWQKEEEVKKMNKEKEVPEKRQKGISNTVCSVSNSVQNTAGEGKSPVPTLNQQILSVLFTDAKYASNENTSKPPSNIEAKVRSDKRHNSDRLITTERVRNEKRSTFLVENTQNSNIVTETSANSNSNKGQTEKLKDSLAAGFKKHMTTNLTKPSKTVLNASLDIMRNKSAEYSLSQSRERLNVAMPVDKKRNSQQIKTIQPHDQVRQKPPTKERKLGEYGEKEAFSYLGHKSTVQKLINSGKYSTLSSRPISNGKSRDSPFMSRSRTVQTEQSPENRSQDSRMMNNYTSIPNAEMVNGAYYGTYTKKVPVELKENRSQSRGAVKSSSYIKSMIAEHLIKKIGSKAV